ncbi:hypothetical protein V0288_12110 [Pannus brasiliensis CCIBt3594]|uniref:Band 7 domain-containing protein n=1 Tax=Pannus brasiliensis CCIBt3594 TaxID=1427578 RepID=A0AAW9QU82_9CHRO
MRIIEHARDRLVLHFQYSFFETLIFGSGFIFTGLFIILFGALAVRQTEGSWILSSATGVALTALGVFSIVKYPGFNTITFDKGRNRFLWERGTFPNRPAAKSLEIPLDVIVGVTIADTGDTESASYNLVLILEPAYWRVSLHSDRYYIRVEWLARSIAEFLNAPYFPDESKAPLPLDRQKILEGAAPYQFGWKYLEEEIDRLEKHVGRYPTDAGACLELGVLLRSKPAEAIVYLQRAESLFEARQEVDRARSVAVLRSLVNWKN